MTSMPMFVLAAVLAQTPTAPAPITPEQSAVYATAAKVDAVKAQLAVPGVSPREKVKLKKALMHASARAREARERAAAVQLQKEQQAYIDKMMPIWLEQQRQNISFSIEAAKAQAMQQMAATAERQRRDNLYLNYQRNQIEAQSLQQLSR